MGPDEADEADEQRGQDDQREFDDVEMSDGSWGDRQAAGRRSRRWLLLLLVIAVVALVLIQLPSHLGRSASPAPTGSSARSALTAGTAGSTGSRGSTSRAPSVTDLGRPPLGITGDWDLFASGDGVMVRIDFASARLTRTTVPSLDSDGPVSFVAVGAGAIVRPLYSVPGYLVPDGQQARTLSGALSTGDPVVPGPDPDHVWVDLGNGVDSSVIRLVGPEGRPSGPAIRKPVNAQGWIMPDGSGYPMLQTTGGIYDLRPGGARRIATGVVLASGRTGWLVVGCDDRNRCTGAVVDRETWRRRTLPDLPRALTEAQGALSPDGRTAALVGSGADGRSTLWLVDLGSGRSSQVRVRLAPGADGEPNTVAWSPDSRWLFLTDDRGALLAIETATERVQPLGLHLPRLSQVVVRDSR